MNFIQKLHFFMHLIVLFLFVLQTVNANCEKDSKTVMNKLNEALREAMPSIICRLKTRYQRKSISGVEEKLLTIAFEMLEEGIKLSLNGVEQINEESLLEEKMSKMVIDDELDKNEVIYSIKTWFKELKLYLSQDGRNQQPESLFQYKEQKGTFNALCIKLMEKCLNYNADAFKHVSHKKKKGFRVHSDKPISNYAYQYIFPHFKLFSCSYKNEHDKTNKFFFKITGTFPNNYAILFKEVDTDVISLKKLGAVKVVKPFAVMNITDFTKSI